MQHLVALLADTFNFRTNGLRQSLKAVHLEVENLDLEAPLLLVLSKQGKVKKENLDRKHDWNPDGCQQ